MSSGPSGWLPLVFTTLGAGVAGSIITAYGTQARARRKARSRAMTALEQIEATRRVRKGWVDPEQDRMTINHAAQEPGSADAPPQWPSDTQPRPPWRRTLTPVQPGAGHATVHQPALADQEYEHDIDHSDQENDQGGPRPDQETISKPPRTPAGSCATAYYYEDGNVR